MPHAESWGAAVFSDCVRAEFWGTQARGETCQQGWFSLLPGHQAGGKGELGTSAIRSPLEGQRLPSYKGWWPRGLRAVGAASSGADLAEDSDALGRGHGAQRATRPRQVSSRTEAPPRSQGQGQLGPHKGRSGPWRPRGTPLLSAIGGLFVAPDESLHRCLLVGSNGSGAPGCGRMEGGHVGRHEHLSGLTAWYLCADPAVGPPRDSGTVGEQAAST